MKCAIIDIGSNSMRLTAYEAERTAFRILFKEKIMAGLAGYVEDGRLSEEGIVRAKDGLLEFRRTLEALQLSRVSVFATASLRNVSNTRQAALAIREATGFSIEVITGEEEALYGYRGAMAELRLDRGIFADIGGASTEMAVFSGGTLAQAASVPIGSLKLYRECVKKLLPGKGALEKMALMVEETLSGPGLPLPPEETVPLVCVGGTARAALKLARRTFRLPEGCRVCTAEQLEELCVLLFRADRRAVDLILKTEPERIHTLLPGLVILRALSRRFRAQELMISQYGVREGFLCQRVQSEL